jgi:hypothetical protein
MRYLWTMGTVLLAACGGGGVSPSDPPPTDAAATITLSATGVSPKEVRVPVNSRVRFINNDSRPHAVSSDPIDLHTDCPPINEVGTIAVGQNKTTGRLSNIRSCGFHDHNNETDPTWKGTIIIVP